MAIRYPNGQVHIPIDSDKSKIRQPSSKSNFANRGMRFEEAINGSNEYYLARGLAVVHKKPTPIQIVSVDYPKRSAAVIKEAYFKEASTTDYNGVFNGHYLDFEAKETKNKQSFPLRNFHEHQIQHMKQCLKQKAICFVLLWFSSLNRCFFYSAEELLNDWDCTERKSIPLKKIEKNGIEIPPGIAPRIPYLSAITTYLQLKETSYGQSNTTELKK